MKVNIEYDKTPVFLEAFPERENRKTEEKAEIRRIQKLVGITPEDEPDLVTYNEELIFGTMLFGASTMVCGFLIGFLVATVYYGN